MFKKKFFKKNLKATIYDNNTASITDIKNIISLVPFIKKTSLLQLLKVKVYKYIFFIEGFYEYLKYQTLRNVFNYIKLSFKNYSYISFLKKDSNFKYFKITETKKQSFSNISNYRNSTIVNYSIGLILCTLGFKKNKIFRNLKKQQKGFLKYLNFLKYFILPKYFKNTSEDTNKIGLSICGVGKYTPEYLILHKFLKKFNTKIAFLLFLPKIRFSFMKLRRYARIKRNFRKRIVKSLSLLADPVRSR